MTDWNQRRRVAKNWCARAEDWKWSSAGRDGAQASLPARDASLVSETNEKRGRIESEKENSFFRN